MILMGDVVVQKEDLCRYFSYFEGPDQINLCGCLDGSLAKFIQIYPKEVIEFIECCCFKFRPAEDGMFLFPCFLNEVIKNKNNILGKCLSRWLSSNDIRHVSMAMAFQSHKMNQYTYGKDAYKTVSAALDLTLNDCTRDNMLARIIFRAMGTYYLQSRLAVRLCFSCLNLLRLDLVQCFTDELYEALILVHYHECKKELSSLIVNAPVRFFLGKLLSRAENLFAQVEAHQLCKELAVSTQERAIAYRRNRLLHKQCFEDAMRESLATKLFGEPIRLIRGKGVLRVVPTNSGEPEIKRSDMTETKNVICFPTLIVTHGLRMILLGVSWRIQKDFAV